MSLRAQQAEFSRAALAIASAARRNHFRSVVFSSIGARQGTTSAVYHIGRCLSGELNMKTLLVEANRLQPTWCREFDLDPALSLAALSNGEVSPRDCVQQTASGAFVLPAGKYEHAQQPFESVLCRTVQELQNDFDMLLLDAPPVLESPDLLLAGRVVPRAVLVLEAGRVPYESLRRAQRELEGGNISLIGVILNQQKRIVPSWLDRWLTR